MSTEFTTVYASTHGQHVQLDAAERVGVDGQEYRHHRLMVGNGRTGAVIIAISNDRVLLALSERAAAGAELWELPRGMGEPEESVVETALRELREETGLRPDAAHELGRYVTDSSIFPQPVAVVACDIASTSPEGPADGELLEQKWLPLRDIPTLIATGVIADAHSLAALAIYSAGRADD